jgi:dihydroxyacetone kinase phosphotransfer subunit
MAIGLVIVSHSVKLAEGVAELAGQMAQGVAIATAGGAADGSLGTVMEKVLEALHQVDSADGILVLLDLGSAVMTTEMAVEAFTAEQPSHRVIISPAPLVEGSLDEVAAAAANAHMLPKLSDQHS